MAEDKIHQCLYVEWYKFKQCNIKTCKNFSSVVPTHCLAIDRTIPQGNKLISDVELHRYKYPDEGITTRLVSMKRKYAVERVKSVLVLSEYIDYIRIKYTDSKKTNCKYVYKRVRNKFPLKLKKLNFKQWMTYWLFNQREYEVFLKAKGGECTEFPLYKVLNLTELKFKKYVQLIEKVHEQKAVNDC